MIQKVIRRSVYAVLTLLICLQTVFSIGCNVTLTTAEAASAKVEFASSVKKSASKAATKAGATKKTKIAVANVTNYVDVHSSRSKKSTIKGRLYRGSAAYVLQKKGSWSKISSGSLNGWVQSKFLKTDTQAKTLVKEMNPRVARITASELNVREKASTSSKIILTASKKTCFIILGEKGSWYKVRVTNERTGYISKAYVSVEKGLYTGVTRKEEKKMEALIEEAENAASKKEEKKSKDVEVEQADDKDGSWVSLGSFKITAYCACAKCNGKSNAGKTASGAVPTVSHTIAVDRSVIPLGSKIRIGGSDVVYVAEDTGVKGSHIDVFHSSHAKALQYGVKKLEVYIYQD